MHSERLVAAMNSRHHLTITFRTLGCKLNQCETAQMEEQVRNAGFTVVPWGAQADFRVLNSCTVTAKSDRECRHEVRRAKRRDPGSFMILAGCFAHVSPEAAAAVEGVDLVLGNPDKLDLAAHLEAAALRTRAAGDPTHPSVSVSPYEYPRRFLLLSFATSRDTRALGGADRLRRTCSYCVIPDARGPSCSMPLADVVGQVRILARAGYREVVLTGIHLGMWGRDTGEGTLADLLAALTTLPDGPRLRLSSIEPMELDDGVLSVLQAAGPRVAHHFHVPLQSGSDKVLERMKRPYSAHEYVARVQAIRAVFPDAAIGADVIVGFPGESDDDFAASFSLVETSPVNYLHVFAYSDRPGTAASDMAPKVSPEKVAARSAALRALGRKKRREFLQGFAGSEVEALVLGRRDRSGKLEALTGNYMEVHFEGPDAIMNTYVRLVLDELDEEDKWRAGGSPTPRGRSDECGCSYSGCRKPR